MSPFPTHQWIAPDQTPWPVGFEVCGLDELRYQGFGTEGTSDMTDWSDWRSQKEIQQGGGIPARRTDWKFGDSDGMEACRRGGEPGEDVVRFLFDGNVDFVDAPF